MMQRWANWPLIGTATTVVKHWNRDGGLLLSAAIAYYASLSLFPLLMVLIAGFGMLSRAIPEVRVQQREVLDVVEQNAGAWLADQLAELLADVQTNASVGGPIGLLVLAFAAGGVFVQLESLFDRIWGTKSQPSGFWRSVRTVLYDRLTAFLMLLGLGVFVLVVWLADLALAGVAAYVERWTDAEVWWRGMQFASSFAFSALLFTLAYKLLPKARVPWRSAVIGGLVTALTWQAGLQGLEAFLMSGRYSTYGIIGSFMAVMLWMYYASAVFFLGAELVYVDSQRNKAHNADDKSAEIDSANTSQ